MNKLTGAEINKEYNRACYFTCRECGRSCTFAAGYNHRFDCCGEVVVHAIVRRHRPPFLVRQIVTNPTSAGYATGPSETRKAS